MFVVPVFTVELREERLEDVVLDGSAQMYPHCEMRPAPV
jgi:hypothetical protein